MEGKPYTWPTSAPAPQGIEPGKTYFMKEVGPHQYKFDPDPTEEQRLLEYANKLMKRVFRFR